MPGAKKTRDLQAFFIQNPHACGAAGTTKDEKRRWAAQGGERGVHHNTGHGDRLRLTIASVGHQSPGEVVQAPGSSSKPRTIWSQASRSAAQRKRNQHVRALFFHTKAWRHPVWYTDWQQAMAMAEAEGKPVLLDFHNPG